MASGILVFIEARQGTVKKTSLEALSAARTLAAALAEPVTALVVGPLEPSAELARLAADRRLRDRKRKLLFHRYDGRDSL